MISLQTATDIAMAYREIERAEELLQKVEETMKRHRDETKDIRDSFGRRADGLQLGIPSGPSSHTLYNVQWSLAKPVIQAHIASKRAELATLQQVAASELASDQGKPTADEVPA